MLIRVITGVILVIFILGCMAIRFFYGFSWPLDILFSGFVFLAGVEYWAMARSVISNRGDSSQKRSYPLFKKEDLLYGGFFLFSTLLFIEINRLDLSNNNIFFYSWLPGIVPIFFVFSFFTWVKKCSLEESVLRLAFWLAGLFWILIPGFFLFLSLDAFFSDNIWYKHVFLFTASVVYFSDSGAYFTGHRWGKTKLAPNISPKKTIEGSLGGLVWGAIAGSVFSLVVDSFPLPWFYAALVAIIIAFVGQVGDLIESAYKRIAWVKDSGCCFPGHGGALDRIDSLILGGAVSFSLFYILSLCQSIN